MLSIGTLVAYTMVAIAVLVTRYTPGVQSVKLDDDRTKENTRKWLQSVCCRPGETAAADAPVAVTGFGVDAAGATVVAAAAPAAGAAPVVAACVVGAPGAKVVIGVLAAAGATLTVAGALVVPAAPAGGAAANFPICFLSIRRLTIVRLIDSLMHHT